MLLYLSGFLAFCKTAIFVLGYISNNTLFPEPLSAEEEAEYLQKYITGDQDARNILIERNLRLVAHICKKYNIPNVDNDDLISIGTIGLIKGINTFNLDKGVRLATYASRCIDNEILMYLRSTKKIGAEIYLNEPIGKDKDDNEISLIDVLENDEKNIEDEIDLKIKIKKLYTKMKDILKGREKEIIELRFGLGGNIPKTQNQIAQMMGISRSYVSRIEKKAIGKLNTKLSHEL
ncbi:MAG: RNA polymerase sporulation sigma factor SigK [Clostridia bacterium]|nr:RNA polymerase sporulation sigma factor SigK [Clostridia bacterium]